MYLFCMTRGFTKSHEWLDYDTVTKKGKVGITKYAANALGDIVHVDLPSTGASFTTGESIVSRIYSTVEKDKILFSPR